MNFGKYLIAVLGGFQFGYTIAVMAGAILFLSPALHLHPAYQAFVVSAILIGAFIGSAVAGMLAEKLGRKITQQVVALLFFIGTVIIVFPPSLTGIMLGRIIQGLAAGIVTVVGPMYIAEISPPATRGRNVSCYQLAVTFGILCAYFVSYLFAKIRAWEWMFAVGIIPALIHGVGFFFLPDSSPQASSSDTGSWKNLLKPVYRSPLVIALAINILQQASGINAIIYFAPSIFELCGFKTASTAIFSAVLIGITNFFSTILAIFLIDSKGRKPLLLTGIAGMILSLIALSLACLSSSSYTPWFATASLMLYIACFAFSFGPIPQLMTAELFPNVVRGIGMSVAMLSSWILNFIVVFTFMDLTTYFSQSGTFLIYALFCCIALFYIWKKLPETKGMTLQ